MLLNCINCNHLCRGKRRDESYVDVAFFSPKSLYFLVSDFVSKWTGCLTCILFYCGNLRCISTVEDSFQVMPCIRFAACVLFH